MYLTKQQILSTVQGLPETIELNEFIILFSTMDLKTATTSSQHEVRQTSLLEAAKKYAGCVEGPADLSTNKAYLEGYGE
ncbi:MAG TPA: hypothetical protein DCM38_12905 [Gammaproteobacteria bacterium]|nr:hypothetical protein [Gammaproteobacteria bacterium]